MLLTVYPTNLNNKHIEQIVQVIEQGGVIICPTDTLYAFACDINNVKAARKLAYLKGKVLEKSHFSVVCSNISQVSQYVKPLSNEQFRILKDNLPGPFTFVFNTSPKTPKIFQTKKQTIGVRIPNNNVVLAIVEAFGRPLLTSSLPKEDKSEEDYANPELIDEQYGDKVDLVVNGGEVSNVPSTVVNLTDDQPLIIREGLALPNF
ncbi:MAG: threonylcarbamoyl-AMP synthase [Bacteroidales bacterium]|jgi:tRNA threonylcarbamoyl adenosine modification protein (Sua5/YciO/YrdC/YwlC family)|nr:threonylcarbamoyl-AMP synthase [Bacteroidales bacterium]